jgi:subtilisin family serine protease
MRQRGFAALVLLLAVAGLVSAGSGLAATRGTSAPASGRFLVVAKSNADYAALKAQLAASGTSVVSAMPQIRTLVVVRPLGLASLQANTHVESAVPDRIEQIVPPEDEQPGAQRHTITGPPDPAFDLPGLMWSINRINGPEAWNTTTGSSDVLVGVADTGLDYTHSELASQVAQVVDFTTTESPAICSPTDSELAPMLGAPAADLDFNGHGSWIGGNIAGAADGTGINGIAPSVKLVALKISGWCGSAYDSTILNSFIWAADHGLDVVSISFGGYLDRSDPFQDELYKLYVSTVKYARSLGTVIVASAGNEHTRIGPGGQVISHGILDIPPGGTDLYGLWELPGGVPGVVDVSSTANYVKSAWNTCPADSLAAGSHQWCKPKSDPHQSYGVGTRNQLTYYSNYGPRIDVAAPGGARKFNLPNIDRGGTEGWPWTGIDSVFGGSSVDDGYKAWEDFGITSNWAQEIPCFVMNGFPQFPEDQCYAIIQGTSMAAPHASATVALIASAHPDLRHDPAKLVAALKKSAHKITGNATPGVSASDTSPGDAGGPACPGGYCHLGGAAISDSDAYGAGLVNAAKAVK